MNPIFTETYPCRCGHDGTGVHRCHLGREGGPEIRCPRPGVVRFVATNACLSGMQLKTGVVVGCYCEEHWREFDAGLKDEDIPASLASAWRVSLDEMNERIEKATTPT